MWNWYRREKAKHPPPDLAEDVFYRCLDRGLSFKVTMGNVLTLTPPLILSREQMNFALEAIDASLGEAEEAFGLS